MLRRVLITALVVVLTWVGAGVAMAQTTNGVIAGAVSDAQGGVLPGVTVTARNVDTGAMRNLAAAIGRCRLDVEDVVDAVRCSLRVDGIVHDAFLLAAADTSATVPTRTLVERHYPGIPWSRPEAELEADAGAYHGLFDCSHRSEEHTSELQSH